MQKTVIIIVGPTASGKTKLAIEFASRYKTEIISADSRQCYRELEIGVARPSPEELAKVKHHFIASHSIHENLTAADFELFALRKTTGLFEKHDVVIMVGGTGLYVKAFCEGLDEIPAVEKNLRNRIKQDYERKGIDWLREEIRQKDPLFFKEGEIKNPHRMLRALEVMEVTGKSILSFRNPVKKKRDFAIVKIGLSPPKEILHRNINDRVNRMIESGLVAEAKSLLPYRHLAALQTVGYQELFRYFDGSIPLEKAVELIRQNTRQYAKRQLTWFKKDKEVIWYDPYASDPLSEFESKRNQNVSAG